MSVLDRGGNIFAGIPAQIPEELEHVLHSGGPVTVKRIVSKGQSSPPSGWYDQDDNEWVLVLKGEGLLAFEHEADIRLREGDYCFIPAHKKHRVKWTPGDRETVWLAIHFPVRGEVS